MVQKWRNDCLAVVMVGSLLEFDRCVTAQLNGVGNGKD